MTPDNILRMAREAGLIDFRDADTDEHVQQCLPAWRSFAAMVAAAEREVEDFKTSTVSNYWKDKCAVLTRELEEARKDAERLTGWREKIIKASEQAYGESAIRYKFSLTKNGKCMNTFPKEIDGRWFALVPAEDDGHIGHIARIVAVLESEVRRPHAELIAAQAKEAAPRQARTLER